MTTGIVGLIYGLLSAGYAVVALFFLRFWRETRDRLFALFSVAFALLAAQRALAVLTANWFADTTWLYLMRLLAFVVILVAIVDKNRQARRVRSDTSR